MHILNGNTRIHLDLYRNQLFGRLELKLSDLVPQPSPILSQTPIQFCLPTYDRNFLIAVSGSQNTLQTTTHSFSYAASAAPPKRTGRRVKILKPDGTIHFKKTPKAKRPPQFHRIKRIQNNIIRNQSRTPPPVGAPGDSIRVHEECSPKVDRVKGTTRGTTRRRLRRRAYRQWCSGLNKEWIKGLGPPYPTLPQPKNAARTRAKWFRQSVYWQEDLRRRKGRKAIKFPTTAPLEYASSIRFGALNVQGFADTLKLKNAIQIMQEHKLGILLLSETKSTSYYSYTSDNHLVILSGNNKDRYAGVGAIIAPQLRPFLMDVIQINTRMIHLTFKKRGGNIHIIGVYGPHSGLDLETERIPFWDKLEEHIAKIPQPEPVYVTGDCNVRFQASHRNDQGVTGRFTYGKGPRYIDHNANSNRSLCIGTMGRMNMVEVASYRTPNPIHHITYRDKTAPPQDWSQYLPDPLIMQQFYDILHHTFHTEALAIAANIRSFLDMPVPLPPQKTSPHIDPTLFQRLDHTFTRRQWLNSVNSCQSRLHTGFPSDHYLLLTEVKARLSQKVPKAPRAPPLHYSMEPAQVKEFNDILADLWGDPILDDHNASQPRGEEHTVYTDGSGSSGRCSKRTPAGWGFCYQDHNAWVDCMGPVITDEYHPDYRGAQVGSNNTGEVTAILEAMLYGLQKGWGKLNIRSDSQWAINVITGKWKAKHHKTLVNHAKAIKRQGSLRITLHWIKAHAGHEGNERADRLAEEGKNSTGRHGAQAALPDHTLQATYNREAKVTDILKEAAAQTFHRRRYPQRKPWITEETLQALSKARREEAMQTEDAKRSRNIAKRLARKDKVRWIHHQLAEDTSQTKSRTWNVIRRQKRGFQGKKTHLVVEGKPVPWSQTHSAFRNHLEQKQWSKPPDSEGRGRILNARSAIRAQSEDHNAFSLEELQEALTKTKPKKAAGPDEAPNELFRLLNDDNTQRLLQFYNDIWDKGSVLKEWKEAIVISLYKGKGLDTDPVNYRPISLLNSIYKVFAAMLQIRLSKNHEKHLRETQYGFRAGRGTTAPLHILRRAMEWSEMTANPLYFLFLDWKQAFDSIDHNAMLVALRRFGVSNKALDIIGSIYQDPTFYTTSSNGDKAYGTVGSGIRQGCPLSPYLFIMVLTVIMHDMDVALMSSGVATNTWSVGKPVYDVEYADDTLLLARTTTQLQAILHETEKQASLYGMNLNQSKTEVLVDPRRPTHKIRFLNGQEVPTTTQAKYLGNLISWVKPFDTAFKHRAGLAETSYKKLRLVWNSSMSRKAKLRIFQTVFIPTLIYGLDTLTLQDKHIKRLDAFYLRFLRRIIGIKASYYSRINNHVVWRKAGYPRKPSSFIHNAQSKLLRQVFLSNPKDPFHHVVFSPGYKDRIQSMGRRRGGKVPYWIEVTTQRHFKTLWDQNPGRGILGPNHVYTSILRALRIPFGAVPMRARTRRARR